MCTEAWMLTNSDPLQVSHPQAASEHEESLRFSVIDQKQLLLVWVFFLCL